jgi:hypothetical protein
MLVFAVSPGPVAENSGDVRGNILSLLRAVKQH